MKKRFIIKLVAGFLLLCCLQASAAEQEAKPVSGHCQAIVLLRAMPDTIPAAAQQPVASPAKTVAEKPVAAVIKAVPKARRVSAPKPVQVKVKPVKVIKPKIIKPVLKVL